MDIKTIKQTIFDKAIYYKDVADYMDNLHKEDDKIKALYHREAIINLIMSLGLSDEFSCYLMTGKIR